MKTPVIHTLRELTRESKYNNVKAILVKIDETQFWSEDIQIKANGKIFGVYLIDLTSPTHLCSIEINYPAYWVFNHFENISAWQDNNGEWLPDGDSELTELERTNDSEVSYYTENSSFEVIEKIKYKRTEFNELLNNIDENPERAKSEWIETLLENYNNNHPNL
jgi:hypothetical protein